MLTRVPKYGHHARGMREDGESDVPDFFIGEDAEGLFYFVPQTQHATERLLEVPQKLRSLKREQAGNLLRQLKTLGYSFEGNEQLTESSGFYGPKVNDWREL